MIQFLVIVLIGGIIGYFLGRSEYGDTIQETFDRSKSSVSETYNKTFRKKETADTKPEAVEETNSD